MNDLTRLTAIEAARLIAHRQLSSVELTSACLERIRKRDPGVRAWSHLDDELALRQARAADKAQARAADEAIPLPPLHGVPFGVKDVIDTVDFPTEFGTVIHAGRRPTADATCVTAMRKAGAVLLGKLVTTEYALFTPGETRHPSNFAHTPGGSSSGTAAAVADRQVPLGFGNQTAGSLIRPAAFCGVFALKPTHGVVNTVGILPLQPFFDTLGYMARSVEDLQAFFSVVSGTDQVVPWDMKRKPKIGLCRTWQWACAQPETRFVLEETAQQLTDLGADVREVELPTYCAELPISHRILLCKGVSESLGNDYSRAAESMSPLLRSIIEEGRSTSAETYAQHLRIAEDCRASINGAFADMDAFLCPSAPGEAPQGRATGDPIFQIVWTLLGVPCMNLPVGTGPQGLPVGVQLVGKRHSDAHLLALAKHIAARLNHMQMTSANAQRPA